MKNIPENLCGVFAALPTPFGEDGDVLWDALDAIVDFALANGIEGLCLGGATAEYAACSVENRIEMFARVSQRAAGRAQLICAVGAEHSGQVHQLACAAEHADAIALLFPPPVLLTYPQADLVHFMAAVSAELPLPVLLYNIPQCTRDLGIANVLRLVEEVPNIIGLKDSSGHKPNMEAIRQAKARTPLIFLIGRDELFTEAVEHGAVGIITGIAGVCPELVLPLDENLRAGKREEARVWQDRVNEFISYFGDLQAPWVIKMGFQLRGLNVGTLAWPMRPELERQARKFQDWFSTYLSASRAPVLHPAGS
jgi:4-hydroxy-tetrahydrodipicolinate synthase